MNTVRANIWRTYSWTSSLNRFFGVKISSKIWRLNSNQSWSGLTVAYEYLLYVKCCHLMLVTVVNVKAENLASVAHEFENFNNSIIHLQLFLQEHEENYYLKCGIRVRMWTFFLRNKNNGRSKFVLCMHTHLRIQVGQVPTMRVCPWESIREGIVASWD